MVKTYENQKSYEQICHQQGVSWRGVAERKTKCFHYKDFFYLFCRSIHVSWFRKWTFLLAQFVILTIGLLFTLWFFGDKRGTHNGCYASNHTNFNSLFIDRVVDRNIKSFLYLISFYGMICLFFSLLLFNQNIKVN